MQGPEGVPRERSMLRQVLDPTGLSVNFPDIRGVLNVYTANYTLRTRAEGYVRSQCISGVFDLPARNLDRIIDPNLGNLEHVVDVFYVALNVCPVVLLIGGDMLFGQKPGQCSHHSSGNGSDHVIERCGVLLFRLQPIEFLDPTMNAVKDFSGKSRDDGLPCRSLLTDDPTH
jgi:hypothetical protein